MAISFSSTQRLVSSILPGADRPISALYAVRLGMVALCADLNRQCMKAHAAGGPDDRLEAAFEAALADLARTDNAIMKMTPRDVGDLRLQMEICREATVDDDVDTRVAMLFRNIERLAEPAVQLAA